MSMEVPTGEKFRIDGGTSGTDDSDYFSFGGSGAFGIDAPGIPDGRFVVRNSGKVGVGTSSPRSILELQAYDTGGFGSGPHLTMTNTAGYGWVGLDFVFGSGTSATTKIDVYGGTDASNMLYFFLSGSGSLRQAMTLNYDGTLNVYDGCTVS